MKKFEPRVATRMVPVTTYYCGHCEEGHKTNYRAVACMHRHYMDQIERIRKHHLLTKSHRRGTEELTELEILAHMNKILPGFLGEIAISQP